MAFRAGHGRRSEGRDRIGDPSILSALLGAAAFLLTTFLLGVSDALARAGGGSHGFSGGGGGGSSSGGHLGHQVFYNNGTSSGSSGGSAVAVIVVVVVVVGVIGLTLFLMRRGRRPKTSG